MKQIKLKNGEKINIRTDIDEVTYTEKKLFQQYFAQILYDFETPNIDKLFNDIQVSFDNGRYAEMLFKIENFRQSVKVQEFGTDAWAICFAILIEKKEPEFNVDKLILLFQEIDKKGITEEQIVEAVENFLKAFPHTLAIWKMRAEGLDLMKVLK